MKTFKKYVENLDAIGIGADRASEEQDLFYFIQEIVAWLDEKSKEVEADPLFYNYEFVDFIEHIKLLASQHDILNLQREISKWLLANKKPTDPILSELRQYFQTINTYIKNIVRYSGQWAYKQSKVVQNIISNIKVSGKELNPTTIEKAEHTAIEWTQNQRQSLIKFEQINPSIYKMTTKDYRQIKEWYLVSATWIYDQGWWKGWLVYNAAGSFRAIR